MFIGNGFKYFIVIKILDQELYYFFLLFCYQYYFNLYIPNIINYTFDNIIRLNKFFKILFHFILYIFHYKYFLLN